MYNTEAEDNEKKLKRLDELSIRSPR